MTPILSVAEIATLTVVLLVVEAPPAMEIVPLVGMVVSLDSKLMVSLVTVEILFPASLNQA